MKFKDFKKQIKNEEYNIPNVLNKVQSHAYTKDFQTINICQSSQSPRRYRFSLIITFMLVITFFMAVFISTSVSNNLAKNNIQDQYSFGTVENKQKLSKILKANEDSFLIKFTKKFSFASCKRKVEPTTSSSHLSKSEVQFLGMTKENDTASQELVQESDIVKYDEEYIYSVYKNILTIYKYDSTSINFLKDIILDGDILYSSVKMNLTDKYLIVFFETIDKTIAQIYEINSFELVKYYETRGKVVDSRLIENRFYLITNDLINHKKIENPKYTVDNNVINVDYNDIIYVGNNLNTSYIYITTFNLGSEIRVSSTSLLGPSTWDAVYTSTKYLCLTSSKIISSTSNQSKITTTYVYTLVDNATKFKGIIQENGYVNNQYSLDEYNDMLRVVYSDESKRENLNSLCIYDLKNVDKDTNLIKRIGILDKGIGLEYQTVRSVSFNKEFVFIVTYQEVDPLYKISMANPTAPVIIGRVVAKGYSSFLQPISDDLLLGIGYTDNLELKLSLYNTSNKSEQLGFDYILPYCYDEQEITYVSYAFTKQSDLLVDLESKIVGIPLYYTTSDRLSYFGMIMVKVNENNLMIYNKFMTDNNFEEGEYYFDSSSGKFYQKGEGCWQFVPNESLDFDSSNCIIDSVDLSQQLINFPTIIRYNGGHSMNYYNYKQEINSQFDEDTYKYGIRRTIKVNNYYIGIYSEGLLVLNKDLTLNKIVEKK